MTGLFRKFGKRKSLHLLGTVCVLISFPWVFLPSPKPLSPASQMLYYSAFIVLFQFGWAAVQISHLALITDLTDQEDARTVLTSVRYGFTVISNILVYLTTLLFFGVGDTSQQVGHDDTEEFRNIMLVGISVGLTASVGFHLIVREGGGRTQCESSEETGQKTGILYWLMRPSVYFVGCVYMATRLFVNLTQAYVPFYLQDSVNVGTIYLAVIPLVQFTASFLSSFLTSLANQRWGRHISWTLGSLLGLLTAILIQLLPLHDMQLYGIFLVAILIGASSCILLITSLGLTADLIGSRKGSSAFLYGLMSLTDKVSNGLAVLVIQQELSCLPLYTPDYLDLVTTSPPCDSCHPVTQRPTMLPSTPTPDRSSPCYSFYETVLTYTTASTSLFGLGFVIILAFLVRNKR